MWNKIKEMFKNLPWKHILSLGAIKLGQLLIAWGNKNKDKRKAKKLAKK